MASLRFRLRQTYWRWAAPGKIRGYMERNSVRKLQIGTGANLLPGWLNTTLYPFTPGSVFLTRAKPSSFPMTASIMSSASTLSSIWNLSKRSGCLAAFCVPAAASDRYTGLALYTQPEHEEQQTYIRWIMDTFRPQIGEYNPAQVHGATNSFMTKIQT